MNKVIKIFSADTFAVQSANLICKHINDFIKVKDKCTISLCGGNTPGNVYLSLSKLENIDWSKVFFFWGDERNEPPVSLESNYYVANKFFFLNINIPADHINRIHSELPLDLAAELYQQTIKEFFGNELPSFDIMLLGVGEDGHTASLFPDTDALKNIKDVVAVNNVPQLHTERITLTIPVITNSKKIIFLITGKSKAGIIKEILEFQNEYPAAIIINKSSDVTIILDHDAAMLLEETNKKSDGRPSL